MATTDRADVNLGAEQLPLLDPTTPGSRIHLDSGVLVLGGSQTYDKPQTVCGRAVLADRFVGTIEQVTCQQCLRRRGGQVGVDDHGKG